MRQKLAGSIPITCSIVRKFPLPHRFRLAAKTELDGEFPRFSGEKQAARPFAAGMRSGRRDAPPRLRFIGFQEAREMYDFTARVRYSETDSSGRLGIAGLLNYFQDCATFHSADCGLGIEQLRSRGMAWVLTSWQVALSRMPAFCEQVRITTNPYYIGGFLGKRNFLLETLEGERLAIANSVWTMVDPATGHPTHVAGDIGEKYGLGKPFEMDCAGRRIRFEGEGAGCAPIPVARHMLDTNGHVNNTQYAVLAADLLPQGFEYSQFRVEYKKSAVGGQTLYPMLYALEGRCTVVMADADGKTYAAAEFSR